MSRPELTIAAPQPDTTATNDWEQWLQRQLEPLHRALGQLLAEEREKFERKADAFEIKLAKLTGAVDVLRGAAPPPPAKFPTIKAYENVIYYEGEVVTHNGQHISSAARHCACPAITRVDLSRRSWCRVQRARHL